METLLRNANAEIDWQFAAARKAIEEAVGKEVHRAWIPFVPFLTGAPNISRKELELPIKGTFRRLVAREPSAPELAKYVGFLEANLAQTGDPAGSLKTTLKAIYLSPDPTYWQQAGPGPQG